MKLYKRLTAWILAASLLMLTGCGGKETSTALTAALEGTVETLDPIYATSVTDCTILNHLYENLMRVSVDADGNPTVSNGLAKSVSQEENGDGTVTWTFKLRNAKWSDGQEVTAEDFVYAWQRLVNPKSKSPAAALLSMVAGYDEARESGDLSQLAVTAKNDTTLVVVLDGTCEWFLSGVCTATATVPLRKDVLKSLKKSETEAAGENGEARPWWSNVQRLVTNGPYVVSGQTENTVELTASYYYEGGTVGADTLTIRSVDTPEEGWALYDAGDVDFTWPVPEEQLADLPAQYQARNLSMTAVLYNNGADVLADPQIRQAMALAVDRSALAELAGVTALAAEGLVPDAVPETDSVTFREDGEPLLYNDAEKTAESRKEAAALLEDAGYDSGQDLGTLELLYVDQGCSATVAKALAAQWKEALQMQVEPKAVDADGMKEALQSGDYTMALTDVSSLCNDPEGFLMQWTTHSAGNVIGYSNSAYDTLLAIVATASDSGARAGCLHDAEALLLEDAALSPLYTTGTGWRLQDTLQGAIRDARGWFSFLNVTKRTS